MVTPPGAGRVEAEALVVRYFLEGTAVVEAHHAAEASSRSPSLLPTLMRRLVFMWILWFQIQVLTSHNEHATH